MACCGSEADYTPGIMGSDCLPIARGSTLGQIARVNLRTTYGQLRGEKYRSLVPKRHQIKHLGFLLRWFGTRRPVVQIHSPRPSFPSHFNALRICGAIVSDGVCSARSANKSRLRARNFRQNESEAHFCCPILSKLHILS